jgi:hypothetical protein
VQSFRHRVHSHQLVEEQAGGVADHPPW